MNSHIREKAVLYGEATLPESELLGLFLGDTTAKSILTQFDNLRQLATLSLTELQKFEGIGKATALKLKACLEIARRFQQTSLRLGMQLNSAQQVFSHYHEKLRDQKKERFYSLLLNGKHRLIKEELVSIGSLNFTIVHPREVFAPAIRESAESIILIHNHPSGNPEPSQEDLQITKRLREVGKLVGIEVLDHIIIGNGCYISFLEQKLI